MSYSPRQWKAINHYLKKHNLRPELSAFPVIRYTNKKTGESGEAHISNIEDVYTGDMAKKKREQREDAKEAKRKSTEVKHGFIF